MLECEQRIKAERLGKIADSQMLADHRRIGTAGLAQHVERNTDFHGSPPSNLGGTIGRCHGLVNCCWPLPGRYPGPNARRSWRPRGQLDEAEAEQAQNIAEGHSLPRGCTGESERQAIPARATQS